MPGQRLLTNTVLVLSQIVGPQGIGQKQNSALASAIDWEAQANTNLENRTVALGDALAVGAGH